MENYQILYRIAVTHSYFGGDICMALAYKLNMQSILLVRRRGLLFRQIAANEWMVLYNSMGEGLDTEHDVLELEMSITDPAFTFYTKWEGFRPMGSYELQLPAAEEQIDAVSAIVLSDEKRKVRTSICTVRLQLTKEMLEAAKMKKPMSVTLRFFAPSVQWEYLFIPRGDNGIPGEQLLLEDTTGSLEFSAFEPFEMEGRTVWRTLSRDLISMKFANENHLRLVVQTGDSRQQKRILIARVEPPVPGRFNSGRPGVMRQIYYY